MTSIDPNIVSAMSHVAVTSGSDATSQTTATAQSGRAAFHSATKAGASAVARSARTTRAPSELKRRAQARPIPPSPPVIITVLPSKRTSPLPDIAVRTPPGGISPGGAVAAQLAHHILIDHHTQARRRDGLHHPVPDIEYFRVLDIGKKIVPIVIVVDTEGHLLDDEIWRRQG